MNKFFKRFMCALALVPCFTMFTACGKDPADPTPPAAETPAETPLTEDQMYAKASGFASSIDNRETKLLTVDNTSQEVVSLGTLTKVPASGALGAEPTNNELNEHEQEAVMSHPIIGFVLDMMLGAQKANYNYGYNLEDGTGYMTKYRKAASAFNGDDSLKDPATMIEELGTTFAETDLAGIKACVKVGDKIAQYYKGIGEGYEGADVITGAYVSLDHVSVDITEYILENVSVLSTLSENTTLTLFKDNILSLAGSSEMMEGIEADDTNVTASIVKEGDNYVLTSTMETVEPVAVNIEGMNFEMSLTGTSVITFNDNGLVSSTNNADVTMALVLPNMQELDATTGDPTGNTYTLRLPLVMDLLEVSSFGSTLDTNMLKAENYADYVTGELQNIGITVEYYIDNEYHLGIGGVYGDVANLLDLTQDDNLHATFDNWYLDEDCTVPANIETLPSYTIKLYTKTLEIDEGYAKVKLIIISDEGTMFESTNDLGTSYVSVTDGFDYSTRIGSSTVVSVTVNGEDYGTASPIITVTSKSTVNVVVKTSSQGE